MKRLKRSVAVILSLAIVMTGIYWSENPAEEVQAATESEENSEMLELKFQRGITGATINKIRVVASVDSPNYSAVGFAIDKGDGEQLYTINTKQYPLPRRIKSSVEGLDYSFSPKVVDTSSEYFLTAKWNAVADTKYTVRAWVKTFEGEMVYGQSRCITLDDLSTTDYLNMSFELKAGYELPMSTEDATKYADIPVTYNGTDTTAEVVNVKVDENGGQTVHVNVNNVNRTALPSVTEFVFGEYGSNTFRNLYTTYTGDGTADTTWFDENETEYVIATSADLYGFASINDSFADKTIYMVSDIVVNKDLSYTVTETTNVTTNGQATVTGNGILWTPIGKNVAFAGTFEGNMHTISGIYATGTEDGLGLFAATAKGSTINNLKLVNSYFYNSKNNTGSIVGQCAGSLVNIYSNAYVASKNQGGGLIGQILTSSDYTLAIKQCWFDGNVKAVAGYRHGGIVGNVAGGNIVMQDCLNTGSVYCTNKTFKGGLCGAVEESDGYTIDVTMRYCLSDGLILDYVDSTTIGQVRTGSIVGSIVNPAVVTTTGVYATEDSYNGTERLDGLGYGKSAEGDGFKKIKGITFDNLVGFDTSIWTIDSTTNKPALIMTMPVPE